MQNVYSADTEHLKQLLRELISTSCVTTGSMHNTKQSPSKQKPPITPSKSSRSQHDTTPAFTPSAVYATPPSRFSVKGANTSRDASISGKLNFSKLSSPKPNGAVCVRSKQDILEHNQTDPTLQSGYFLPHRDSVCSRFPIADRFGPPVGWEFDKAGPYFLGDVTWEQVKCGMKPHTTRDISHNTSASSASKTGQWGPHVATTASPGPGAYTPRYQRLSTPLRSSRPSPSAKLNLEHDDNKID